VRAAVVLAVLVLALIWGAWLIFPADSIHTILESRGRSGEFSVSAGEIRKGLFYSLDLDRILLLYKKTQVASFENVHIEVNPLNLAILQLAVSFDGRMAGGKVKGGAVLSRSGIQSEGTFEDVKIGELGGLELAGTGGSGDIKGSFAISDGAFKIDFQILNAELEPLRTAVINVPLGFFRSVRGSLDLQGDRTNVKSVSLEGENIFARVRGSIQSGSMDLVMELMPEKTFLENPLIVSGLQMFKVSPGYYVIPINGNLAAEGVLR
jgi:type II secretion system protein N